LRGRVWTVEEEKLLKEMLEEGKSVSAIARVLGKTRDCVRMKIARLGLDVVVHPTPYPEQQQPIFNCPMNCPVSRRN
jgi:hypothetical protein